MRFQVLTAASMKFRIVIHPWWWRQYAPLKRRSTIILHGSTSQKTILNKTKKQLAEILHVINPLLQTQIACVSFWAIPSSSAVGNDNHCGHHCHAEPYWSILFCYTTTKTFVSRDTAIPVPTGNIIQQTQWLRNSDEQLLTLVSSRE
jgi:hypothetical protein